MPLVYFLKLVLLFGENRMVDHVEEIPMAQDPVPRKVKCAKNLWKAQRLDSFGFGLC